MSLDYIKTTPQYQKIINEIYSEKLDLGLRVCMAVSTNSMYPTIVPGTLIEIEKMQSYAVGDVVVLANARGFLVHRIVKINKNVVIAKGDNNLKEDEFLEVSAIKGKVVSIRSEKRGLVDYASLILNKVRKVFRLLFVKIKNLIFKYSSVPVIKHFLLILYKAQVIIVRFYFKLFESSNLYVRGSSVTGKLKPGLSDIDFTILTKDGSNVESLVKTLKVLSYLSPVISFNSFLPIKIYAILRSAGVIDDYENQVNIKQLSGGLEVTPLKKVLYNKKIIDIHRSLELIGYVDEIIFKFSQMSGYHPSYLFHNIKKLFQKIIKEEKWCNEFVLFEEFLEAPGRAVTLYNDLEEYAKALAKIIKKIKVPKNNLPEIALSDLNKIKINDKDVFIFSKIRNYKSYLLKNDFDHEDLYQIIKYTVDENTYPFSSGIMTFKMATFFQAYYVNFIRFNDFECKEEVINKYLFDSIKFFNNYQTIKMKDRHTIQSAARDIVVLISYLSEKSDENFKLDPKLQHFVHELDCDEGLDANEIYLRYINELNALFINHFE